VRRYHVTFRSSLMVRGTAMAVAWLAEAEFCTGWRASTTLEFVTLKRVIVGRMVSVRRRNARSNVKCSCSSC